MFNSIQDSNKDQPGDDPSSDIDSLLLMPINHITNYAQFLDGLLNEYKSRDLLASDFKTIAAVEIEMKKLQKMVLDNYALNSMKGLPVITFYFFFIFLLIFRRKYFNQRIFLFNTKCVVIVAVHCTKIRFDHLLG